MISLASSADTFSLITEGALSTNPLASTNPNPVISLTALITATLVPPTSVNVTLTSVGSAAAPASAASSYSKLVQQQLHQNFSSIAFN